MKTNNFWLDGPRCLLAAILVLLCACNNENGETDVEPQDDPFIENWSDLIPDMIPSGELIYLDNSSSLIEAVSSAKSGDALIIEGGYYGDDLSDLPPGVTVFGIQNEDGDHVTMSTGELEYEPFQGVSQIRSNIPLEGSPGSGRAALNGVQLIEWSREMITSDIAHYKFILRVGEGEFDIIGLNRVVKERRSFRAIRPDGEIFMVHGASQDFSDIFLVAGSESQTAETSLPVFLAENRVDVWGIDLGWTRIPAETTDFSSLIDWGVNKDSKHTQKAMAFARLIRVLSGSGFGRLNLFGFSYGAAIAYDAAGDETRQFRILRDIKGIIPSDQAFKYSPEDEEFRLNACAGQDARQMSIDQGNYANPQGELISTLGNLALSAPDEPSPIPGFEGFTNQGVVIFTGANSYFTGGSQAPFWHFVGGNQPAPDALATALQFTELGRWNRLYADLPPFMPEQAFLDVTTCACDEEDVDFDDYLSDIRVPVFYYGAGGGTGTLGIYTTSLLGSGDVSSIVVTQDSERYRDFGHADLFLATNAAQVAWPPLLDWLQRH